MKKLCCLLMSACLVATNVSAAGFDCTKASTQVEKTICDNPTLSELDDKLGIKYQKEMASIDEQYQKDLRDYQQQWLKFQRNTCPNATCLIREYQERLGSDIRYGIAWDNPDTLTKADLPNAETFDHFSAAIQITMTNPDSAEGYDVYDEDNHLSIYSVSGKPYLAVVDSVLFFRDAHMCDLTDQLAKWSENHWVINQEVNNQLMELRIYPASRKGKTELLLKDMDYHYGAYACGMNGYFDGLIFKAE